MGRDTASRVLTILGCIFNGVAVALYALVAIIMSLYFDIVIAMIPEIAPIADIFFIFVWFTLFTTLVVGLILPIWAYLNIKPEGKTKAGVILIISGVITLILGGIFGIISGIFFIIAGALTVSWKPYKDELLTPTARTTGPIYEPSEVKPVTTQKGSQFCASCGAQLIGDEQFCPVCGTAIS
jgi:hypothetical protein